MEQARNRSTNIADHDGLLWFFARKAYARLEGANVVGVELEDVYQEMCLSAVRAAEKYNPDLGYSFTAYLGRACWQNFNKVAEKLINEQVGLRLSRIEDLHERFGAEGEESILSFMELGEGESPEDIVERKQHVRHKISRLSPQAKLALSSFIRQSFVSEKRVSFREVIDQLDEPVRVRERVRQELRNLCDEL